MLHERSHTITALVEDEAGALNRIVSTIRRRGFNVDSLNVGASETPGLSRLTMSVAGDEEHIVQCLRQMEKLVSVVEVEELRPDRHVAREIVLVRLEPPRDRDGLYRAVLDLGARTPEATLEDIVVEFTGTPDGIDELVERLRPYNVVEVSRSGMVAMRIGGRTGQRGNDAEPRHSERDDRRSVDS